LADEAASLSTLGLVAHSKKSKVYYRFAAQTTKSSRRTVVPIEFLNQPVGEYAEGFLIAIYCTLVAPALFRSQIPMQKEKPYNDEPLSSDFAIEMVAIEARVTVWLPCCIWSTRRGWRSFPHVNR
jgi:hypothetical protein